jgi:DNA repair exonuclease SbcCD ATPase subunit
MQINKLILKNFQLFKDQTIILDKINLITGINYDDIASSGNGSGKTTILSALLFGLFGEVTDINLKDLIKIGTKECSVIVEGSQNGEHYRIYRAIPNSLKIYKNEIEVQFNNSTIAQKYLKELFGSDFQHFRTYNLIDQKKGINLLDLGTISLRKALMEFCAEMFTKIRTDLLSKKLERETYNVNKRLYSFNLSDKRLMILEMGLRKLQEELNTVKKDCEEQSKIIGNYKSEVDSRKKIIYFKEQDKKKLNNGYCPILSIKCPTLSNKQTEVETAKAKEIEIIESEIKEINNLITNEEDCMQNYNAMYESTQKHVQKTKEYLMKLKEAQKFSAYKYTLKDVQLYTDSIKVLDNFSAYFISSYLDNLNIIINDLLKPLNICINFTLDKEFITINNNGQEINYSQLSGGQKKFLGVIFKLGILLQEGINSGLLLFDEGLGEMDFINLYRLLDILKELNFQCLIVYQNIQVDKSIQDVNYINIIRQNNESKII